MAGGFRFDETMSGTYERLDTPGTRRPLAFSVECIATSLLRHLRDSELALSGTFEADGLAECVPTEGTMLLSPVRQRLIRYQLAFVGDDGRSYRFEGQKDIRLRDPLRSFTQLPATIYDEHGKPVALADTAFDLRGDLLQFLASWRRI